jgi:hypothetical protein
VDDRTLTLEAPKTCYDKAEAVFRKVVDLVAEDRGAGRQR